MTQKKLVALKPKQLTGKIHNLDSSYQFKDKWRRVPNPEMTNSENIKSKFANIG